MSTMKIDIETDEQANFEHFLGMAYKAARHKIQGGMENRDEDAILWAIGALSEKQAELRKLKGSDDADDPVVDALEKALERARLNVA